MNLDAVGLALIVGLAIALVEGIKQAFESLAGKELSSGAKVILSVVTGTILASAAEFAPETWVRVIPILTAGLAAAGLYSISKRAGSGAAKAIQTKRLIGSSEAFTTLVDLTEEGDDLVDDDTWADFLDSMTPKIEDPYGDNGKDEDDKPYRPVTDHLPPQEDPDGSDEKPVAGWDGVIDSTGTDDVSVPVP